MAVTMVSHSCLLEEQGPICNSVAASFKVGNRPVSMHIDQTSGHNWFYPVITGRLGDT